MSIGGGERERTIAEFERERRPGVGQDRQSGLGVPGRVFERPGIERQWPMNMADPGVERPLCTLPSQGGVCGLSFDMERVSLNQSGCRPVLIVIAPFEWECFRGAGQMLRHV